MAAGGLEVQSFPDLVNLIRGAKALPVAFIDPPPVHVNIAPHFRFWVQIIAQTDEPGTMVRMLRIGKCARWMWNVNRNFSTIDSILYGTQVEGCDFYSQPPGVTSRPTAGYGTLLLDFFEQLNIACNVIYCNLYDAAKQTFCGCQEYTFATVRRLTTGMSWYNSRGFIPLRLASDTIVSRNIIDEAVDAFNTAFKATQLYLLSTPASLAVQQLETLTEIASIRYNALAETQRNSDYLADITRRILHMIDRISRQRSSASLLFVLGTLASANRAVVAKPLLVRGLQAVLSEPLAAGAKIEYRAVSDSTIEVRFPNDLNHHLYNWFVRLFITTLSVIDDLPVGTTVRTNDGVAVAVLQQDLPDEVKGDARYCSSCHQAESEDELTVCSGCGESFPKPRKTWQFLTTADAVQFIDLPALHELYLIKQLESSLHQAKLKHSRLSAAVTWVRDDGDLQAFYLRFVTAMYANDAAACQAFREIQDLDVTKHIEETIWGNIPPANVKFYREPASGAALDWTFETVTTETPAGPFLVRQLRYSSSRVTRRRRRASKFIEVVAD